MSFKKLMAASLIVTMILSLLTFNVSAGVLLQESTDNLWQNLDSDTFDDYGIIERTEEDEYREWKNSLASEYLETADVTPRTALRMQALSATQNLFGNEYLEAYVRNDGRFTMGTRQGNPNISTDDNKILLFGHPEPWSSFTTIKINGINYTFDADGPPTVNAEGTEAVSVMTKDGVTVKQIITLMNNPSTNRKDVFRIEYQMTNNSGTTCSIGARIMLDTMLGSNDGAPLKFRA